MTRFPEDLRIEVLSRADGAEVSLHGELVFENAAKLGHRLHEVETSQPSTLVLDLRDLRFIDSTGLSELVRAHQRAQVASRRLVIVNQPGAIERILTISGLIGAFEVTREIPPLAQPPSAT